MIARCLYPGCTRAPYAGALCAEYASERLLSALRAHVAGDDAAWGRVETVGELTRVAA